MAAACGKFGNSDELRWFPFKLVSALSSRCHTSVSFTLDSDFLPRPNWRIVFRNRQVGLRIAQLGMTQTGAWCVSAENWSFFRRFRLTSPSTRRSPLRRDDRWDPDAFVFLLSPFLFPSHPSLYVFLFSNYQS